MIYWYPWQFKVGMDGTAKMYLATAVEKLAKSCVKIRATKDDNFA